jgi:gluconate 2-dehydrogenase gamma chain
MAGMRRRDLLRLLAAAPAAAGFSWNEAEASAAHTLAQVAGATQSPGTPFTPAFFTAHEYETVRLLADLIIPRDERSGGAVDAGVPEFMDFLLAEEPKLPEASRRQTAMRGGLAWLDLECQRRFDATFVACTEAQRTALLDDISQAPPVEEIVDEPAVGEPASLPIRAHGRAFFASFRDLTATGFWTSRMGMTDLQFQGNRVVVDWTGCPPAALAKLGVRYPDA